MSATAQQKVSIHDSVKILLASAPKTVNGKIVLRERNVVYPVIFEKHREESSSFTENFANKKSSYIQSLYLRGKRLTPKAQAIFKKYGVPTELALLMGLESGFSAKAISRAGAYGYWQFMDAVAVQYGLKIADKNAAPAFLPNGKPVPVVDERENFTKSTYAAAKLLKNLSRIYNNDWLLVAAAYNWGPGNLNGLINRTGKRSFWELKNFMPSETRNYVQNLIALSVVHKNYNKFLKNDLVFDDILGADYVPVNDMAL